MKKYLLAISISMTLSTSMVNAQALAQAAKVAKASKDIILLAPDIIILIDAMQKMPQYAQTLKDPSKSKAAKVVAAQEVLMLMTQLQPILQGLLDASANIATAVDQQANADKIKIVRGYVNDGFSALKDISDILEVVQLLHEPEPEALHAEPM